MKNEVRRVTTREIKKVTSRMSKSALMSIYVGAIFANYSKRNILLVDDLLRAIAINPFGIVSKMLSAIGFDKDKLLWGYRKMVVNFDDMVKVVTKDIERIKLSAEIKAIIVDAYKIAHDLGHVYVGTEHLFLAALKRSSKVKDKFKELGIDEKTATRLVLDYVSYPRGILTGLKHTPKGMRRVLDMFGEDLVEFAKKGKIDPLVGREEELEKVINVLSRRKKNNALIVGEPGVGKTSLVEGLAQKIMQNLVPPSLRDSHIIRVNVNKILAGSNMRGDVEEKVMAIIRAAKADLSTILFFDDIHTLLGAGSVSGGGVDIASILKPELTSGEIRCIGVTTLSGYRTIFEDNAAFNRRFQQILISEPTTKETIQILQKTSGILERHHNVKIDPGAIGAVARLSSRYVGDRNLPDKAIDLLDESCATVKIMAESSLNLGKLEKEYKGVKTQKEIAVKKGNIAKAYNLRIMEENLKSHLDEIRSQRVKSIQGMKVVTQDVIRKVISEWTGIPVSTLTTGEASSLKTLDKTIGKRIIGQSEAIEKVVAAIKRGRTGISDVNRPWSSFLFLGPTGVGKSELAKELARQLFGDRNRLVQIDMSELMEMHSVSKLIGSPPGYVGYKEGGQLTEKVRNNPYSVVLFDEIEKAHEDVLNILLQILEYGQVTDGKGHKVSFKNTVIILTSNVGIDELKIGNTVGFKAVETRDFEWDYETVKTKLLGELKDYLKPELLNRLDDVIVFRPLRKKEVEKIVDIMIREFNERISEQWLSIEIDSKVRALLLKDGFDQEYGARPLRRAIQRNLETVVADYIIDNGTAVGKKRVKLLLTVGNKGVVVAKMK